MKNKNKSSRELGFKTLDSLKKDFPDIEERKEKTVLLRSDLNSDVKSGKVLKSERIKESVETIKELKNLGFKVVVIAHQGKPGKEDFTSLKQHSEQMKKYIQVKYVQDVIGKKAKNQIKKLKPKEVLILDNIRKIKDEFKPDKKTNSLVKNLLPLADIYVNDAFSVCHREQTSITRFPREKKLKKRNYAGRLLEREVSALKKLEKLKGNKLEDCLYILSGSKPEDNIKLLGKNSVLAGGLFGQACVISQGKNLGEQNKFLEKKITDFDEIVKKIKEKFSSGAKEITETPVDFGVKIPDNKKNKKRGKRKDIPLNKFPSEYEIFDIGKKTQKRFLKKIKKAKAVYMKGPVGYTEDKEFSEGTVKILKAISKNKGFSLIGGGHLSNTIERYNIPKSKFNHISLSGGALLNFVAGKKLPGLEVLRGN